jgi:hypothetical protein
VRFYDTGHFALETHYLEIAGAIRDFFDRRVKTQVRAAEGGGSARTGDHPAGGAILLGGREQR